MVWRIDRFELIYYNARHKRWQYFAEDPLVGFRQESQRHRGESPHRRQIRRFLYMVRQTVSKLVSFRASEFAMRQSSREETQRIRVGLPSFPKWKKSWDEYIAYLEASAVSEGVSEHDKTSLKTLKNDLSISKKGKGFTELTRAGAIALLSLLPILEEWDTWGCFLRARKRATGNATRRMGFPRNSRNHVSWFQPFYIAELSYDVEGQVRCRSKSILNSTVEIEAACTDLASSNALRSQDFSPRGDFFDYCKEPRSTKRNDELYLYRCYAHFVDTLIKELSEPSRHRRQRKRSIKRRYFYIAYPIQNAGRLHFLQIALTTTNSAVNLKTLWEQWAPMHKLFWTPQCRSVLEAELERIALSAFQYGASTMVRERQSDERQSDEIDDAFLRGVLAENIYHLFPIRTLKANGKTWHYTRYVFDKERRVGIPECVLGYEWGPHSTKRLSLAGTNRKNLIGFALPSLFEGKTPKIGRFELQEPLTKQRVLQTIEQQMDYLNDLKSTIRAESDIAREDRSRANWIVSMQIDTLEEAVKDAIRSGDISAVLRSQVDVKKLGLKEPHRTPEEFEHRPHDLERYLFQENAGRSREDYVDRIQQPLDPSILELAGMFFDTSLVKLATHRRFTPELFFSGTIQQALTEVTSGSVFRVQQVLGKRMRGVGFDDFANRLEKSFQEFADAMSSKGTLDELKGIAIDRGLSLGQLRADWREEYLKVCGQEQWGLDIFFKPEYWLRDWLACYENEFQTRVKRTIKRELSIDDIVITRKLHKAIMPIPLLHSGSRPVVLDVQHVALPYVIHDSSKLEATANIFLEWNDKCEACARLYVRQPQDHIKLRRSIPAPWADAAAPPKLFDVERRSDNSEIFADIFQKLESVHSHDQGSLILEFRSWAVDEKGEHVATAGAL